mgnify:CR=1 FL=1
MAVVADALAHSLLIEVGPLSAGLAARVAPGPAEGVGRGDEGRGVEHAGPSLPQDVPAVAGGAGAVAAPGVAGVGDGETGLLGAEVEAGGAGEAVVAAVPGEAAGVGLLLPEEDPAGAVEERVALIAGLADALRLVEVAALGRDLAADALGVEEVSLGALEACLAVPLAAAEVVVESHQQFWLRPHQILDWAGLPLGTPQQKNNGQQGGKNGLH